MNYVGVGQWRDGLLMTLKLAAGGALQRGETTEQRGMRLMHRLKLADHSWMHGLQVK